MSKELALKLAPKFSQEYQDHHQTTRFSFTEQTLIEFATRYHTEDQARIRELEGALKDLRGLCSPKYCWPLIDEALSRPADYSALNEALAKAIADEKQNPWKAAVIDELVVCHIYTAEHDNNPRKAIKDAIQWNCEVALDPRVSSAMNEALAAECERLAEALERGRPGWSDAVYWLREEAAAHRGAARKEGK